MIEPASSAWEADVLPMYESCVAWILRGVLGYHSIFFAKKQPFSGEEKKPGLRREARGDSAELGASGNGVVEHDEVELFFTLFLMHGGEQHAARLLAHHLSGREVDDGGERLADKGFRLVELRDAGEDLPVGAGAVVEREAQELVGLLDALAGLDLDDAEVGLAEGVEVDLFLELRLDLNGGQQGALLRGLELLELGQRLGRVDAREDGLALVDGHGLRELAPGVGSLPGADVGACADLCEDLAAGFRDERQQQRRTDADGLEQVIHDGGQPRLVRLVLGKGPGHGLVDILVGALDALEDLLQAVLELELLHLRLIPVTQAREHGDERLVGLAGLTCLGQRAAEVLFGHRRRAGDEIAEIVGKVNVDRIDQQLVGEVAVGAEGERAQQEEAQRVHTEFFRQQIRVDDVALGLGHLAAVHDEPAVAVDVLRQRHTHAHEHGGPDDGVEADDLLADEVHVRGPVFVVVVILLIHEAERRGVVEQRVDPDVDHMARVEIDRHTPGEAGTGDAEVFEARIDEVVDHLVDAGLGLEKVGRRQQLTHAAGVFGEAEEIGFLRRVVDFAAAVGAFAVLELALGPEALTGGAVFALVFALIDIAVLIHLAEDLLDGLHMIIVRRADEAVVGDVHQLPEVQDALRARDDVVDELLRGDARGLGLVFDLLAVLVGAGQEHHVVALQPLIAGHGVGRHGAVGMADVQLRRGIVDRRGDIKCLFACFAHSIFLFSARSE